MLTVSCLPALQIVAAPSHENKTSPRWNQSFVAWSRAARASPRGSRTSGSVYVHETWVKVATLMSITELLTARDRASIPSHNVLSARLRSHSCGLPT